MRSFSLLCVVVFAGCTAAHSPKSSKGTSFEPKVQHTVMPTKVFQKKVPPKEEGIVVKESKRKSTLQELIHIPQSAQHYLRDSSKYINDTLYLADIEQFSDNYFRVWERNDLSVSVKEAGWFFEHFDENNSYGFTLQPLKKDFFARLKQNANWSAMGSIQKYAVSVSHLNVRAVPTDEPVFLDPNKAGEGFPFDYVQNTLLAANKPLLVSHYSKDKQWAFVEFSFGYGWVHVKDLVYIPERYAQKWKNAYQIFLLQDGVSLYDEEGNFLFNSRVGMVLPLIAEGKDTFTLLGVSKKGQKANYHRIKVSKTIAHNGILPFSQKNVGKIMDVLQKGKYGWGGIYEQRDCSSTLRDLYTPFGIWLPRNSSKQAQVGKVIQLSKLSNSEKIQKIKRDAIPFRTLLYKPGHIALYVGTYKSDVVIFQNVWGVKTKNKQGKEGRFVVARPVFSSLELGKELPSFDTKNSMLSKLQSMNTVQ